MFGLMSGFYDAYMTPPKISLLIIGCDDAGKTAFLERCKIMDFTSVDATNHHIIKTATTTKTTAGGGDGAATAKTLRQQRQDQQQEQQQQSLMSSASSLDNNMKEDTHVSTSTTPIIHETVSKKEGGAVTPVERHDDDMSHQSVLAYDRGGGIGSSVTHTGPYRRGRSPPPTLMRPLSPLSTKKPLSLSTPSSSSKAIPMEVPTSTSLPPPVSKRNSDYIYPNASTLPPALIGPSQPMASYEGGGGGGEGMPMPIPIPPQRRRRRPGRRGDDPNSFERISKTEEIELKYQRLLATLKSTAGQNLIKHVPVVVPGKTSLLSSSTTTRAAAHVTMWDLAGSITMRPLWERYYGDVDGIIFVVDGTVLRCHHIGHTLHKHDSCDGGGRNGRGDNDDDDGVRIGRRGGEDSTTPTRRTTSATTTTRALTGDDDGSTTTTVDQDEVYEYMKELQEMEFRWGDTQRAFHSVLQSLRRQTQQQAPPQQQQEQEGSGDVGPINNDRRGDGTRKESSPVVDGGSGFGGGCGLSSVPKPIPILIFVNKADELRRSGLFHYGNEDMTKTTSSAPPQRSSLASSSSASHDHVGGAGETTGGNLGGGRVRDDDDNGDAHVDTAAATALEASYDLLMKEDVVEMTTQWLLSSSSSSQEELEGGGCETKSSLHGMTGNNNAAIMSDMVKKGNTLGSSTMTTQTQLVVRNPQPQKDGGDRGNGCGGTDKSGISPLIHDDTMEQHSIHILVGSAKTGEGVHLAIMWIVRAALNHASMAAQQT